MSKRKDRILKWIKECEQRALDKNKQNVFVRGYIPRITNGKMVVAKAMGMTLKQLDRYIS